MAQSTLFQPPWVYPELLAEADQTTASPSQKEEKKTTPKRPLPSPVRDTVLAGLTSDRGTLLHIAKLVSGGTTIYVGPVSFIVKKTRGCFISFTSTPDGDKYEADHSLIKTELKVKYTSKLHTSDFLCGVRKQMEEWGATKTEGVSICAHTSSGKKVTLEDVEEGLCWFYLKVGTSTLPLNRIKTGPKPLCMSSGDGEFFPLMMAATPLALSKDGTVVRRGHNDPVDFAFPNQSRYKTYSVPSGHCPPLETLCSMRVAAQRLHISFNLSKRALMTHVLAFKKNAARAKRRHAADKDCSVESTPDSEEDSDTKLKRSRGAAVITMLKTRLEKRRPPTDEEPSAKLKKTVACDSDEEEDSERELKRSQGAAVIKMLKTHLEKRRPPTDEEPSAKLRKTVACDSDEEEDMPADTTPLPPAQKMEEESLSDSSEVSTSSSESD